MLCSCDRNRKTQNIANENLDVKKVLMDSSFIDIDIESIAAEQSSLATKSSDLEARLVLARAAIYRFYNHVKLLDGYYVCSLKSPEEINVSQSVFNSLRKNLDEMNSYIRSVRDSGDSITVPDVDEAYLNSLLK